MENTILTKQKEYFLKGNTLPIAFRKQALHKLDQAIDNYTDKLYEAIYLDLGKSKTEAYMCEIGLVKSEIKYMLKHINKLTKEKRVPTPLAQFASRSFQKPTPYGNVLIMSPWNYPFLLSIDPLVDAIAAGNTIILKPSAYSSHTSSVIKEMIESIFDHEYVLVVEGGRKENEYLLSLNFDYIFFTGSKAVGKIVMSHASSNLTPITLELGGKSPCIVDESANIKLAAKRIIFGKFINCGQTCVAPDYIYVKDTVKDQLVLALKQEIQTQYPNALNNADYGKIINEKHFMRLLNLINQDKVVIGGNSNPHTNQIEPTIMDNVTFDDEVMQDEIFGPILPILTYNSIDEVINKLHTLEAPLALYLFSNNKQTIETIKNRITYGGGCINDTIIHLATSNLGFGGVKESGMGSYHGKYGFDTFTHYKSIVDKKTWIDLPIRYQPYTINKDKLIKLFLK